MTKRPHTYSSSWLGSCPDHSLVPQELQPCCTESKDMPFWLRSVTFASRTKLPRDILLTMSLDRRWEKWGYKYCWALNSKESSVGVWKKSELCYVSVQFSCSAMSSSLWPHGLQHARHPCPSPIPRACSNSCQLSRWCHPIISTSVIPFSCLQSFPASGSFPMSQFFPSGGQSIGASASVLPMNIQDWFPLGLTDCISLQFKGLSRVFSNIIVQNY